MGYVEYHDSPAIVGQRSWFFVALNEILASIISAKQAQPYFT